jgi:thiol-disulfide isomerase/thioredoxin
MKYLLIFGLIMFSIQVYGQDSVYIEGSIDKSMDAKEIRLQVFYPFMGILENPPAVETRVKNGKFTFSMKALGVETYMISIDSNGTRIRSPLFVLPPTKIRVEFLDLTLNKVNVYGNYLAKQDSLYHMAISAATSAKEQVQFTKTWLIENPCSPLSPQILYGLMEIEKVTDKEIIDLFTLFPDSNKNISSGQEIAYRIKHTIVGAAALNFTESDTAGHSILLSDFKGKYVLLDFWASWCTPCRAENPNLVKAYKLYHKKGIEFISVSNDEQRANWTKAILDDHLSWYQVFDSRPKNKLRNLYRITGIPTNFLIDPSGKIIAKDLQGADLLETLRKLKSTKVVGSERQVAL